MFERILVPLDGSSLAKQVFPYVAALARAFRSEVILISIYEPEETEYGEACKLYIDDEADALKKLIGDTAVTVSAESHCGVAANEILRLADEHKASLIMMTSHGRSGIVPWSLGGTVNKVLHKVGVPLLVVRAKEKPSAADKADLFGLILLPLDGSQNGEAALPYVADITRKLGSELCLLKVVEPGKHVHTIGGLDYIPFKDMDISARKKEALQYLEGIGARLADIKGKIKPEVRVGDAAREILKSTESKRSSLIAVSSHGDSAIEAWAHGSVTYKVLYSSKQSILFVPSPEIKRK